MTQLARVPPKEQLVPIDIMTPGRLGLNLEQAASVLNTDYCTVAQNAVIDPAGRLSARYGVGTYSTTAFTTATQTQTIFEYNAGSGTYQQIAVGTNGTTQQVANSWNGIAAAQLGAGTASMSTANRWFCQNFNNKLVAFQNGQKPVVYSAGTPLWNLIVESSGTWSTSSGVGCAAFGRVWSCKNDGHTIEYSGLLDETDRGSASSGVIDMQTIWANGTDTVTAIFAFNAALVVCGKKHIIMFTDGRGSTIGLDPTQAYVFDVLTGTGCLSQWTVDFVGESDVLFLSPNGVQSLQRLLSDRNNATQNLTKYVRTTLLAQVGNETYNNITGSYNAFLGQYFLTLPNSSSVWVLDMKRKYQDDIGNLCAVVTSWNIKTYCLATDHTYATFFGIAGKVASYSGYSDYTGMTYAYTYTSGQLNFAQQLGQLAPHIKLLKRIEAYLYTAGGYTLGLSWTEDFGTAIHSASIDVPSAGAQSQYGLGQYGNSQYGGGNALTLIKYPARGRAQYYQFTVNAPITGALALQQMQVAAKIGRVA